VSAAGTIFKPTKFKTMPNDGIYPPALLISTCIVVGIILLSFIVYWFTNRKEKARFVLHPGMSSSIHDNEDHYISYAQLINCYQLDINTDHVIKHDKTYRKQPNDIWLFPLQRGNYIEVRDTWLKHKNLKR
jgi:hypothetical protein